MAELIKIYESNPNEKEIARVVKVLKRGGIIIYPTDTVYGLGCDITNTKAMELVAKLKGIKLSKANLSFICYDLSSLSDYVRQIDTPTYKILKRALPGPYTFVLPGNSIPIRAESMVIYQQPHNSLMYTGIQFIKLDLVEFTLLKKYIDRSTEQN